MEVVDALVGSSALGKRTPGQLIGFTSKRASGLVVVEAFAAGGLPARAVACCSSASYTTFSNCKGCVHQSSRPAASTAECSENFQKWSRKRDLDDNQHKGNAW